MILITMKVFIQRVNFVDETWVMKTCIAQSDPERFQTWICDVSNEEIRLGLKLNQIGMFMRDLSETKRGLSWQSLLMESGDVPVIGGDNIIRYGINNVKGFVSSEDLDPPTEKIEFLQKPKVMSQRIIAHIEDPKPHIKNYRDSGSNRRCIKRRYSHKYCSYR